MATADPILAAVTAPGSPFEIGEREGLRQFVNAPADLNQLIESARRFGDATFIVEGDQRLSFADVFAARDALVVELGIAPGEPVALCMKNSAEWLIGFLAIQKAGGVAVLVNSRGSAPELVAMVESVGVGLVLADEVRAGLLRDSGYGGRLFSPSPSGEGLGWGVEAGERASSNSLVPTAPPPAPPLKGRGDGAAAILFTSGTTGRVKGAVLTHRNLITGIMSVQMAGMMVLHSMAAQHGVPAETIIANMPQGAGILVYPLFHISGLGAGFLSPMIAGNKIVIMDRWEPEAALRIIEEEKITQLTAVPTMLWDLINRAQMDNADLSSVRNIGTGGQALPVNLLEAIHEACPHAVLGTGYGLTETAGSVAMTVGEDFFRKPASAGRVLTLVDMVTLGDDGAPLPQGEIGEIAVRGPMVMQGYWNAPDATEAVLSADGWFRTGDIGYVDADGFVFIVDRAKDMVISGGENIYCAEVERVIGAMPGVSEFAAFGIPDDRMGEVLVAAVIAEGLTDEAIKAEVSAKLAKYKAPVHIHFANSPLPRNHMGKVDKIALRAAWSELIGPQLMGEDV